MQGVSHLQSVAVNDNRLAVQHPQQEMRDPALVLGAELTWSVDAAHPQHRRSQAEHARVVGHILIGGALRAAIRAVKVERSVFPHPPSKLLARRDIARLL